ncbi:hypothetical protein OKW51_002291 [Pseudomonas hunanensis]|nr:hypothetical protein [Pseudomonas hunanensis]
MTSAGEYRHPGVTEQLGEVLQGHRLAGARGSGHQAMPVGQAHGLGYRLTIRPRPYNHS